MVFTRRRFLCSTAAGSLLGATQALFPSEITRYADPATEFPVLRLTDPRNSAWLPNYYARALSRRGASLLYASDRTGSVQAYWMDLKSGASRQLTDLRDMGPQSLALVPDEKSICCIAGNALHLVSLLNGRERVVFEAQGTALGTGLAISEDGLHACVVERRSGTYALRLIPLTKGAPTTVIESPDEISDPSPRPRRAGILYRKAGKELHVINYDGAQDQRLRTTGALGPALWLADGRAVDYLSFPEDRRQLNTVHEYVPDAHEDRLVASTTQFVHFGKNADASVYAGASGSKASPYLILLVRNVRRELTLCEHKASDPRIVAPIFSPNSQRIFFQSDRHGKRAIYSMQVERLVEETEEA